MNSKIHYDYMFSIITHKDSRRYYKKEDALNFLAFKFTRTFN